MLYSNVDDMTRFMSLFFREGPAGGKQVLGSYSLREMSIPVAVSTDLTKDAQGRATQLWRAGSNMGWTSGIWYGEQVDYKDGGTAGFSCMVLINYLRKLGIVVLMNTQGEPVNILAPALSKLTPVVVKSLERSQARARQEIVPSWQKYTGRYVLTDPNAIRTVTFSEYGVSIVNQKLVLTVPELRPGSVVYMKEIPLEPFGDNVFRVGGGSFYGNFISFESSKDGITALKQLRLEPKTKDIPVIAITASAMTYNRQTMLAEGFDGYQTKPISLKDLLGEVQRVLATAK